MSSMSQLPSVGAGPPIVCMLLLNCKQKLKDTGY
jgi:hypothetical protein